MTEHGEITVQSKWARPRAKVDRHDCFFYHTTQFKNGDVAAGQWDLRGRFPDYIGHVDLSETRVLDVGTASGFLSFSAEEAGAHEVVSFDLDTAARQHLLPFSDSLYVTHHAAWVDAQTAAFEGWKNAYWFTHHDRASRARAVYGDVYDLPTHIGVFDVVILGSILEHLGDPIRAFGSIAKVATDRIVINTDIMPGDSPIARFNGDPAHPERSYIFWTYTLETYRRILRICGFLIERVAEAEYLASCNSTGKSEMRLSPRTTIVARRA